MRDIAATVSGRSFPWESATVLRLETPGLAAVAPGQFVLLGAGTPGASLIPIPLLPWTIASGTTLDILFTRAESLASLEGVIRLDLPLRLRGPGGRPFNVEGKTRRALLLGQDEGLGPLLHLAADLVRRGVDVTLIVPRASESHAMPASALPLEVEYVTPGNDEVLERLEGLLDWADALYLAIPPDQLPAILDLLRRRLLRLRKGFAQALLAPPPMPCGIGACDLCTVRTTAGYRRACRDGLVFDLLSLV
ncbi:MAG: hypothetical protein ACRDGS_08925 [Chloroflexota bacterium]